MRFNIYIAYYYSSSIDAPDTHLLFNRFYTTLAVLKILFHGKAKYTPILDYQNYIHSSHMKCPPEADDEY